MSLRLHTFASELSKIAEKKSSKDRESEKKKKGYGAALVATAPAATVQALADYPKGYADKKVETAVGQGIKKAKKVEAWRTGAGRSVGRLGAGIVTAPLFFEGIEDIKKGDERKGYAKVVGSSGAFALGKAGIEGLIEGQKDKAGKKKGKGVAGALKAVREVAGVRGVLGTASGALTAAGVAKASRDRSKGKKEDKTKRFLVPAAIGGGIGATKGAIEELVVSKGKTTPRRVAAKASGRGTAGIIGALAISEIARKLSKGKGKGKEKKAEVLASGVAIPGSQPMPSMAPNPSEIYSRTREISREQETDDLERFLRGQKDPERTPSRRAVTYAVNDELRRRGVDVPEEKIRSNTQPPMVPGTTLLHTAAAAAVVTAPSLVWSIGLNDLPVDQRDTILRDAMDRMIAAEGIEQVDAGIDFKGRLRFDRKPGSFYAKYSPGEINPDKMVIGKGPKATKARAAMSDGARRFIASGKHRDPFIQAHELGHATAGSLRRRTIASSGAQLAHGIARIPAVILPLLALDSAADKSFHTPEEIEAKAKFSERVGLVALALGAPHLAEEATASVKGMRYLRRAGANNRQLLRGTTLRLAPAFATYAAPFATGSLVAKFLRSRAEQAEKQQK